MIAHLFAAASLLNSVKKLIKSILKPFTSKASYLLKNPFFLDLSSSLAKTFIVSS